MNDMPETQLGNLLESALDAINNNDISLALEQLLQAAENEPENVEIINQVARCYMRLGEFDRALACWNMAQVIDPSNEQAEQAMKEFNDLPFQFWLKRYREAVAELENRNYEKGSAMLTDLICEQDGFVTLYQLLGLCHFAGSDMEAARLVWSRGLALDTSNEVLKRYLNLQRGDSVMAAKDPYLARGGKDRSRTAAAGWLLVACLGMFLLIQIGIGFYHHITVASVSNSHQLTGHYSSPVSAKGKKVPLHNEAQLNGSFPEDSSQGDAYDTEKELEYYEHGFKAYLLGDWTTACSNLGVVVSMHSGNYINREALYYLAQSNYFRKDYQPAREYFEKYLSAFPDSDYDDDALYYLGCCADKQGDVNTALNAFTRLAKIDPHSGYLSTPEYTAIMNQQ